MCRLFAGPFQVSPKVVLSVSTKMALNDRFHCVAARRVASVSIVPLCYLFVMDGGEVLLNIMRHNRPVFSDCLNVIRRLNNDNNSNDYQVVLHFIAIIIWTIWGTKILKWIFSCLM